jgi:phosphoglycerate kinase
VGRTRTRTLADLPDREIEGRRVLARVDYNVPLTGSGEVADPTRIEATLPTLRHLLGARARLLLVAHLGRPKGERDPSLSLGPVADYLSDRLGADVPLLTPAPGSGELEAAADAVEPGGAALLENIRFHPGETKNDHGLSRSLGELAEVYVGDAFGAAHRAHASTVGAAEVIREKGGPAVAGHLMERELQFLRDALREPARPFVAVLGGAKISGKIDLIEAILPKVDRILVGGAMANTFLRALGLDTGRSLVEEDRIELAREVLERAGEKLVLPVDAVVGKEIGDDVPTRTVDRGEVGPEERIGDIGPTTRELFAREIAGARTLLWNGPMGVFEANSFAGGTEHVARAIAEAADGGAVAIVGGGDSAAAAEAAGVVDRMTHVSTGGGASLDLLAGKTLPGVEVLETVEEG